MASLLSDDRPLLQQTLGKLETIQQPFADDPAKLDKLLSEYPTAITLISRAGGVYGDFFNFCDITLTLNGLQPGGPVRKVRITKQPTGGARRNDDLPGIQPDRVGLLGLLIVSWSWPARAGASVPMLFAKPMYYADFADSAGVAPGDKVRISGYDVGQIKSLKIDGDRVRVGSPLGVPHRG